MIFTGNIRNLIHLFITIVARTIFIKEFIQRRYNFFSIQTSHSNLVCIFLMHCMQLFSIMKIAFDSRNSHFHFAMNLVIKIWEERKKSRKLRTESKWNMYYFALFKVNFRFFINLRLNKYIGLSNSKVSNLESQIESENSVKLRF